MLDVACASLHESTRSYFANGVTNKTSCVQMHIVYESSSPATIDHFATSVKHRQLASVDLAKHKSSDASSVAMHHVAEGVRLVCNWNNELS
jgi:hypothetical protein